MKQCKGLVSAGSFLEKFLTTPDRPDRDTNAFETHLGYVEEPKQVGRGRVLCVERSAGKDGVSVPVGDHEGLHAHIRAQDNLCSKEAKQKGVRRMRSGALRTKGGVFPDLTSTHVEDS